MKTHENLLKKALFCLRRAALALCIGTVFAPSAHSSPNQNQAMEKEAATLGIPLPKSIYATDTKTENETAQPKNSATDSASIVEALKKRSSSEIAPSPAPHNQPDESGKGTVAPAVEKPAVPSDAKPEPPVTLPTGATQTTPAQVPTTGAPVEKDMEKKKEANSASPAVSAPKAEMGVPADSTKAKQPEAALPAVSAVPGVSPATPDIAAKEKTPKKACTTAEFIGTWKGQFLNAYGKTAATLTVKEREGKPYCVFTFYPLRENPGAGSGQFEMSVCLDENTGDCELRGTRWLKNPKRRALMHLRGKLNGNEFSGKIFADIPTPDDWTFKLEKKAQ